MTNITKKPLVQLVLSSTLFMVVPLAFGATVISTAVTVPPPLSTTVTGDITITNTGSVTGTGFGIVGDDGDVKVTIDPNNVNPFALHTNLDPIRIDIASGTITLTVGENSAIKGDTRAMLLNNGGLDLLNNGTITGGAAIGLAGGSTFVNIINTSIGQIVATGGGSALQFTSTATTGTVSNQGIISSTTDPAISVRFIAGINNTGTISTTNADAIVMNDAVGTITNGIVNSGTITAGGVGNNAINLGLTTKNITFTNNAPGIVNGNVIVSSNAAAGTVLLMNGGTINGTVSALAATGNRTYTVNGGTIAGGIDLSATSTGINLIQQFGGTIGNILGGPSNTFLAILGSVTTGGTITNVGAIGVQAPFTVNNNITNTGVLSVFTNNGVVFNNSFISASAVNITSGGIFQANPTGTMVVSGALTNNSRLILKAPTPGSNVNVTTNTYSQSSSGTLEVEIKDKTAFGNMNITGPGVTNIANDILKIDVTGTGLIQNLDTFRVVHNVGGGTFTGSFILLEPSLSTIKFIDVSTPQDIILEAIRTPFSVLTTSDITTPPAQVIDEILSSGVPLSPEFEAFIIALDNLSPVDINTALTTVVPQFDGGLVQLSHSIQKNVFDGLGQYIDEHRPLTSLIPGYVAGDVGMGRGSQLAYSRGNWAKVFSTRAIQQAEQVSDGYDLDNIGFIFGYDQYCSDRIVLGGALSYATGEVRSKAPSASRQEASSFQLTAYSTYDYKCPGYLDVMAAVSFNEYTSTRNIQAGSFFSTALGQFDAWQYGVNLESGYRFSYGKYRIIPVGRLLYSYLQIDNYTETGAGGLNLSVVNNKIEEGITGIGIKFNATNDYREATYVPEIRFNIVYDWIADAQVMTSNFLEGGSPFITNGIKPHPCTYNIGLSLTALAKESLVLVLNYELNLNQGYVDNSISMKFRYEW